MAVVFIILVLAASIAVADWTDCPSPCRCKWASGKKTALCMNAGFTAVPDILDSEMQVLNISGNIIESLPKDAFRSVGLINLQRIFMRNAKLRQVHRDAFRELIILIEVDLSENEIISLEPNTFHGNERLRLLALNFNPLRRLVRAQFPVLPHLRTLEFEGCFLESVDRDAFIHLTALDILNLKSNKLRSLSEAMFMGFAHLKALALDGNPWRCDCELRGFRDWFLSSNLQPVPLTCAEPEWLEGLTWNEIAPEEFACPPQVYLSTNSQVQAEAGGNVTFGCHVIGDPEPQVTWLYDGQPINHTWLILEAEEGLLDKWANISVINVSDVDAGVYSCVAKNSLDSVSRNVTLVLPEVVTATTVSKANTSLVWWGVLCAGVAVLVSVTFTVIAVCCVRNRNNRTKRSLKASVSFTDQEKKLLDVSIATTTDRGTGSSEALGPEMDMVDPPVHITIESEPMPVAVFPPPPEFSNAFGNIYISVSVSRDPSMDVSGCPDLLDLPHRTKPVYHGVATLPRRMSSHHVVPQYDNMGPRVTAAGSCSTLSEVPPPPPPPPPNSAQITPEFVSL